LPPTPPQPSTLTLCPFLISQHPLPGCLVRFSPTFPYPKSGCGSNRSSLACQPLTWKVTPHSQLISLLYPRSLFSFSPNDTPPPPAPPPAGSPLLTTPALYAHPMFPQFFPHIDPRPLEVLSQRALPFPIPISASFFPRVSGFQNFLTPFPPFPLSPRLLWVLSSLFQSVKQDFPLKTALSPSFFSFSPFSFSFFFFLTPYIDANLMVLVVAFFQFTFFSVYFSSDPNYAWSKKRAFPVCPPLFSYFSSLWSPGFFLSILILDLRTVVEEFLSSPFFPLARFVSSFFDVFFHLSGCSCPKSIFPLHSSPLFLHPLPLADTIIRILLVSPPPPLCLCVPPLSAGHGAVRFLRIMLSLLFDCSHPFLAPCCASTCCLFFSHLCMTQNLDASLLPISLSTLPFFPPGGLFDSGG